MHILQIGLPKSGNFWLHTILSNIIQAAQIEHHSFIQAQPIYHVAHTWDMSVRRQIDIDFLDITTNALFYRIGNIYRYPVDNLDRYIAASTLVWSHSQWCTLTPLVLPKFDKVIYIVRDPRDVAVSWSNFVFTPYMRRYYPWHTVAIADPQDYLHHNLHQVVADWVSHVGGYVRQRSQFPIYFICYERLVLDFAQELDRLLQYLEIELDDIGKQAVIEAVDFTNMKKDNPHHLHKGRLGQWENVLNPQQQTDILPQVSPLLKIFNYSMKGPLTTIPAPETSIEAIDIGPIDTVRLLTPAPH